MTGGHAEPAVRLTLGKIPIALAAGGPGEPFAVTFQARQGESSAKFEWRGRAEDHRQAAARAREDLSDAIALTRGTTNSWARQTISENFSHALCRRSPDDGSIPLTYELTGDIGRMERHCDERSASRDEKDALVNVAILADPILRRAGSQGGIRWLAQSEEAPGRGFTVSLRFEEASKRGVPVSRQTVRIAACAALAKEVGSCAEYLAGSYKPTGPASVRAAEEAEGCPAQRAALLGLLRRMRFHNLADEIEAGSR